MLFIAWLHSRTIRRPTTFDSFRLSPFFIPSSMYFSTFFKQGLADKVSVQEPTARNSRPLRVLHMTLRYSSNSTYLRTHHLIPNSEAIPTVLYVDLKAAKKAKILIADTVPPVKLFPASDRTPSSSPSRGTSPPPSNKKTHVPSSRVDSMVRSG
jgi:hypothetical protein